MMKVFGAFSSLFAWWFSGVVLSLWAPPSFAAVEDAEVSADDSIEETVRPNRLPPSIALDLQYSPIQYRRYEFTPGRFPDRSSQGGRLGVEWLPITGFGKMGVGLGIGATVLPDTQLGVEDRATTLYTFPLDAFLSYRFDYVDNQFIVPFLKVGAELTLVNQGSRTGGVTIPGFQSYYGLDYGVGLAINLNHIDPFSAKSFEGSVGVKTTYLVVEYLRSTFLSKARNPNLSYDAFRFGLRFEM